MKPCLLAVMALISAVSLTGCDSYDYTSSVESSRIGATTYTPSVYIEPGNEAKYYEVLDTCRDVASNRQLTAAQTAALRTETGVTDAAVQGTLEGLSETIFSEGDVSGASIAGLFTGMIGAAASGSSRGTVATAAATREALLNCLHTTGEGGKLWTVLE